jgi:hypothetical protein
MTRLSNRQYPMLRMFCDMKPDEYMSIEDAMQWDQRPFRSMLIQKWVSYKHNQGFYATSAGRQAMEEFRNTDIGRQNPHAPLTSYFDKASYRSRKPAPRKVHVLAA